MAVVDMNRQRSLLLSARLRFSPDVQHIRASATDKIVEQILYAADEDTGMPDWEILRQAQTTFAGGLPALTAFEVRASLVRLLAEDRIIANRGLFEDAYQLSAAARDEMKALQQQTDERFRKVVGRLFRAAPDPDDFAEPFLDCLCSVFSRVGEAYVRVLTGERKAAEFLSPKMLFTVLAETRDTYPALDKDLFRVAVLKFFEDEDPDFAAIKWHLAQSYYISKALGFDPTGSLLSKEILEQAVFYLDTNIIIPAVEGRAKHHLSVQVLIAACHQLGIPLRVCQVSLDQLRSVTQYLMGILPAAAAQVPDATSSKIRGVFYRMYKEELEAEGNVDMGTLFSAFFAPHSCLRSYGIELVDDEWFTTAPQAPETKRIAEALNASVVARGRIPKGTPSAVHDAMLALWVHRTREAGVPNCWLVTLDTSFADCSWFPASKRPIAITLDALLQWLSPLAAQADGSFEACYAEAIKYTLLPQEIFFDIRDFLIFDEIHYACKELPPEDVEECLRYIKSELPRIDASTATGREALHHEIARFFQDPGRKHAAVVSRLEAETSAMREEYERRIAALSQERDQQDRLYASRISDLERRLSEKDAAEREQMLLRSGLKRFALSCVLVVIIEAVILTALNVFISGLNLAEKAIKGWGILLGGLVCSAFLGRIIVGKERLRAIRKWLRI